MMTLVNNLEEFEQLIKIMKSNYVDKVKIGELEVNITIHLLPEEQGKPSFSDIMEETEDDEEELRTWSSK